MIFGEYRPDVTDYNTQFTKTAQNVLPRWDGYGPFPSYQALSTSLPGPCRGIFYAIKSDGSLVIFGATATKLYLLNNTTYAWGDVSLGAGSYSAVSGDAQWQFVQFNNYVVAVQANAAPQYIDITVLTAFANISTLGPDTPPQAAYVSIVGRFLVLSGLTSFPYRIQWSGLGNIGQWTSGVNSSDFQDFADGGLVRGVAGGENGVIFQDTAIRGLVYQPGSPVIFQIERLTQDMGLYGPYSIIRAGNLVFFNSSQGFMKTDGVSPPVPIGRERVDRTFRLDLDNTNFQLFMGASDPRSTKVYWAYKSVGNGTTTFFDKLLSYDYVLDKFAGPILFNGEMLVSLAQPGMTLEGLDSITTNLDALIPSLDTFGSGKNPSLGAVDNSHTMGFFSGPSLEATVESAEYGQPNQRTMIQSYRPITDAPTMYGAVTFRENMQALPQTTTEQPMDAIQQVPARISTRYARAHVRIPAGTVWTFINSVEPESVPDGAR